MSGSPHRSDHGSGVTMDTRSAPLHIGGANQTDGAEMDIKELLGNFPSAIAAVALCVSAYSLFLSWRRDRRDIDAKRPTCDVSFRKLGGDHRYTGMIFVYNNGNNTLTLKDLKIIEPSDWTFCSYVPKTNSSSLNLDFTKINDRVNLDRHPLRPGLPARKQIGIRLKDEAQLIATESGDITFALTIRMGGKKDQEERFIIHRAIND